MYGMNTKAKREEYLQAEFKNLSATGYTHTTHNDLNIFVNSSELILKLYRGTSTKAVTYTRYRSIESLNSSVDTYKSNSDRNKEYKDNRPKNKSSHANAAGTVKAELQKAFKGVKFSCKSDSFSGGDAVRISWTDGPTTNEVDAIAKKYQYGHFDGTTDMYEGSNRRDDLPQSKFVTTSRDMSNELKEQLWERGEKLFNEDPMGMRDANNWIYRVFAASSIDPKATNITIQKNDKTSGICSPEEFYYIAYTAPQQAKSKAAPNLKKVEVEEGKIQVIAYSDKAIAVVGDTKPIKDKLKALGGRFNFRLTCGAGWIFPKSKLADLQQALQ